MLLSGVHSLDIAVAGSLGALIGVLGTIVDAVVTRFAAN